MQFKVPRTFFTVVVGVITLGLLSPMVYATPKSLNLSIAKAAVAPDGTTVGALTDFVFTFKDINPDKKGERLHPGATIEVVLSDAFTNTGAGGNTAAILQGWPQSPPAPPPLFPWTIDVDGNTITLTLTDDFKPGENGPHPGQSRFI